MKLDRGAIAELLWLVELPKCLQNVCSMVR